MSDSSEWTAAWAISILEDLVNDGNGLDKFCDEIERASAYFAAIYPDDDESIDLSDHLVWFFVADAFATCSMIRHGRRSTADAPAVLSSWLPSS